LQDRPDVGCVDVFSLPLRRGVRSFSRALRKGRLVQLQAPLDRQVLTVCHVAAVLRRLRQAPAAILHAHGTGVFQLALMLACRWRGTPMVWTLHGITEIETGNRFREIPSLSGWLRWRLYATTERLMQRLAGEIIVDTGYVRHFIGARSRRVHVIPAGIWLDETAASGGQDRDPDLVLSVGVIHPRKGHHLLLEAFAAARAERPHARLVIAGALSDPDYAAKLEAALDTLNLRDCVVIRTDLPKSEIALLQARASIFALHSQEESQGIALCEAMAFGMPVVSTRVGGIPFVVEDGLDGMLTDYGDVAGFAAALSSLLGNQALHQSMSLHAREAARRFDWPIVADQTLAVYHMAIGRAAIGRYRSAGHAEESLQANAVRPQFSQPVPAMAIAQEGPDDGF
jgi:glycosyltransferase involved in cell wall biosynthesis